jgi:hypothetical protein
VKAILPNMTRLNCPTGVLVVAVVAIMSAGTPAGADLVKLQNGGEIRGKIAGGTATSRVNAETIVLQTLNGVTIAVAKADTKFLTMRPVTVEEYETRARRIGDTAQEHWDLAEWCRQQSLSKQRENHLLRVVDHDPHHEKAQAALGRVWHEGGWVDRDEMMAARGYVKYKGRYVTTQELDLIQKTADELATERDWFQKVKSWHGWLTGRNEERYRQALLGLQQIDDPHAAPAVIRFLCEDKNREIRSLGVTTLSRLTGSKGTAGLVKLSLFDVDDEVRYASLNGIKNEDYEYAQTAYIRELRNGLNPVASGLGAGTLPPEVEIAIRTGQLPQGAVMAPPIGGAPAVPRKMVTVTVNQPNQEVLTALQKLTGQNFGFDERTWRLWWAAEKNSGVDAPVVKKL